MSMIYLDHNATTPMLDEAINAVASVSVLPCNASSIHSLGRQARHVTEEARASVQSVFGADQMRVIFTSSGTEANQLALRGIRNAITVMVATEHVSVLKAVNADCIIPVDPSGLVSMETLDKLLEHVMTDNVGRRQIICSVMLANNETGVIQPIKEIARCVHRYGGLLHMDASQACGKIPISMQDLDVDMMTISAHKFGGPIGVGALIARRSIPIVPMILGGGQEQGYRAGTENVPALAGLKAALDHIPKRIVSMQRIAQLRDQMEQSLVSFGAHVVAATNGIPRLPNTSCVIMPGVSHHVQLIECDSHNIMVSTGSACSSGKVDVSHVLLAMGYSASDAGQAIRISLGPEQKKSEIEIFIHCWFTLYQRVGQRLKHVS